MAEILPANMDSYKKAIALLKAGQAVALPTETVYGLAALAQPEQAALNIFTIKKRPLDLAMSICVFNQKQAQDICQITPFAKQLMNAFWPGPLTLVLPKKENAGISKFANAGLPTVGLRCPGIEWRRGFQELGFTEPLILTSANTSSRPNPLTAQDVQKDIGEKIPLILDGGACQNTHASTIIAIENGKAKCLRAGALKPEHFASLEIEWQK